MNDYRRVEDEQYALWEAERAQRLEEILNTPNMTTPEGAVTYYVSAEGNDGADGRTPGTAWKSLARVNAVEEENAFILFRRGDVFRGQIVPKPGMTLTAYGSGPKPRIYGSPEDGADPALWHESDVPGVWVYEHPFTEDVGTMVFDHGKAHAFKTVLDAAPGGEATADHHSGPCINKTYRTPFKDHHDLRNELDFWHDDATRVIYLRSRENPGKRFSSIEFNVKHNVIAVRANEVTVDNLCIKYGGAHGVGAGTVAGLTVRNCEIGWIGGTIQFIKDGRTTRYGNGVEIYGGCDRYTVENNWVYQCYDAAITQQYRLLDIEVRAGTDKSQRRVTYRRNLIEYNNYSIEYFLDAVPENNPTRMEHFLIEDNLMLHAGEGFCEQRPDHLQGAHIKGWQHTNRAYDYVIRRNRFILSHELIFHVYSNLKNPDGSDSMPIVTENVILHKKDGVFGVYAQDAPERVPYNGFLMHYLPEKADGNTFLFY